MSSYMRLVWLIEYIYIKPEPKYNCQKWGPGWVASYPGLLTPAFVMYPGLPLHCNTNVGEGLLKLSHEQ